MSDDESFVILGSCSPGNSLSTNGSLQHGFHSLEKSKIEKDAADDKTPVASFSGKTENTNAALTNSEIDDVAKLAISQPIEAIKAKLLEAQKEDELKDNLKNDTNNTLEPNAETKQNISQQNSTTMKSSNSSGASANGSLATSFILGEINADVLKSSVYSQFPSLCSLEACAEDVVKLQNFMSEYVELKSTLSKVNSTMRLFYDKTQQWREETQQYKQQLENCQLQIAKLRNENLDIKQEMENKMEQMKIADDLQKKEVSDMIKLISEKAALIENLRAQIELLEKQTLSSFEYISTKSKEKNEYIPRSEHLLSMKENERKMSQLLAENLELKDMQKVYIDEINCLKVNLTATDELLKRSRRDIDFLKANDLEKSVRFTEYEKESEKMREEILLLRQQVDVYGKDFQMERTARENLAGEKDQLLQDLRNMQRANQELIEEQERRLRSAMQTNASTNTRSQNDANSSTSSSSSRIATEQVSVRIIPKPSRTATFETNLHNRALPQTIQTNRTGVEQFHCPVCGGGFESLSILQNHVNSCLDNS